MSTRVIHKDDITREWEKTLAIDNPLNPWKRLYIKELAKISPVSRVDIHVMSKVFKPARCIALIGGAAFIILFIVVIPGIALSFDNLSFEAFTGWLRFSFAICVLGMMFVVIAPPVEETFKIYRAYRMRKRKGYSDGITVDGNERCQVNTNC